MSTKSMAWLNKRPDNGRAITRLAVIVGIPVLLTAVYLWGLAQDRYVSESKVVVKRAAEISAPGFDLGGLLGAGNPATREDALYLQEYILSGDMLRRVDKAIGLRKAYAQPGRDLLYRLDPAASREDVLEYYQDRIEARFDDKSGILTIRTQGFSPDTALRFNEAILAESDRFINALSQRIAQDQERFAHTELSRGREQLEATRERLLAFQNDHLMLDPQAQAEAATKSIAELEAKRAQMEADLRGLRAYLNEDASQVVSARNALAAIRAQIVAEKAGLASPKGEKLNAVVAQYKMLQSDMDFKTDLYKVALATAEKTRLDSVRKVKSLAVITPPEMPEEAEYPRRGYILLTVLVAGLLLFWLARLVWAVIEDHKD